MVQHRFHVRKIKRLHVLISRYSKSEDKNRQRMVKKAYRQLIERTRWIARVCDEVNVDQSMTEICTALRGMAAAQAAKPARTESLGCNDC